MYILNNGVQDIKEKGFIGKLFCKHEFIEGEKCSSMGLVRLNGSTILEVCVKCGYVNKENKINYD